MASTSVSKIVSAEPGRVWQLVGGFGSLPDWLPYITGSTLEAGGRRRRLSNPDGDTIVERLVDYDDVRMNYSYAIVEAPFPVVDYLSNLRVYPVTSDPRKAEVQWSGRFVPQGATDDEVVALFTGIYTDGLDALRQTLG
ncbi:SRPBCC family protein [Streptomyces sp. NBC_01497]|uniref:SRPBCC family protein n=1 Tax=Streptomyces sp. NBC_01497 TaxID=2903885 RepID=UPI002E3272DC|nr:SRPBCC family protein [Streptomyces sp. NBC_01497]